MTLPFLFFVFFSSAEVRVHSHSIIIARLQGLQLTTLFPQGKLLDHYEDHHESYSFDFYLFIEPIEGLIIRSKETHICKKIITGN